MINLQVISLFHPKIVRLELICIQSQGFEEFAEFTKYI